MDDGKQLGEQFGDTDKWENKRVDAIGSCITSISKDRWGELINIKARMLINWTNDLGKYKVKMGVEVLESMEKGPIFICGENTVFTGGGWSLFQLLYLRNL